MGKYERFDYQTRKKPPPKIHPIWRGIGCMMLILIPVVAYAAANVFADVAPNWTVFGRPIFPYTSNLYGVYYPFRAI